MTQNDGDKCDLEKRIALLEKKLKETRSLAATTTTHFGNERRLLEGLIQLKEDDIRDFERLLKGSQNRGDRMLVEVRECRIELMQRQNQHRDDQVTIANLRVQNAELTAMLRSLYARTGRTSEVSVPQPPAADTDAALTD